MLYKQFIKPLLFLFAPEQAHHLIFRTLKIILKIPGLAGLVRIRSVVHAPQLYREIAGLNFKNPVGLAAGLDKNALLFDELYTLGFGFIEIGTVTPKPQSGNPQPRLFRLPKDEALINRMGFNNDGADEIVKRLKKKKTDVIIGGNIGKNKTTPNAEAVNDYIICLNKLHPYVDYFVINVSSPNTPELRELQAKKPLSLLLTKIQEENNKNKSPKPIFVKIAPDLGNKEIDDIIEIVLQTKLAGIIATNTTIARSGLKTTKKEIESIGAGGLSGKPIKNTSTEKIRYIAEKANGRFKIIGVGGIHSPADAIEKLNAGADLIQVYTGFIYSGPALMKKINKAIIAQYEESENN